MASPLPVTLIGPLPGDGWTSIERYCQQILAASGEGLDVRLAPSLEGSFGPIGASVARYRRLPALLAESYLPGLLHVSDQALAHVLDALPRRPSVVTCHDLIPLTLRSAKPGFREWLDLTLLGRSLAAMARATRMMAISEATRRDMVRLLDVNPARIDVVPNIVSALYSPLAGCEPWLASRGIRLPPGPRILSVGTTRPYKNLSLAIEACSLLAGKGVTLVRAGSHLSPELASAANGRIVELGHQEPDAIAHLYGACDVLLQPSLSEGFGLPVAEAMACGLPVVCSDGGALPEVAGGAASVVQLDPAETAAERFARAIERVLSEPQHRAMLRQRGLARAEAFRPAAVLPRLLEVYRRASEERSL